MPRTRDLKGRRESPRWRLVGVAAGLLVLLVVQVAVAQSGTGSHSPRARAAASIRRQISKLKAQVAQLRTQVDAVSKQQGPQGPPGPQGEQGPPGLSTGPAGGDLTGSYPDPQIAADAVTGAEVFNASLTANDLGANSVGNSEIVDGSIDSTELATVPTARVRRTTNQTIAASSLTTLSFTTETWDTANLHASNNPNLTAPVDGVYLISGSVIFQGGTGGLRELELDVNNTKPIADDQDDARTSAIDVLNASTIYRLSAGDDVRMKVQQSASSGTVSVIASSGGAETSPELSMTFLGPA
jgi:hypothetical protein